MSSRRGVLIAVMALLVLSCQLSPRIPLGEAKGSVRDVALYAHYDEDIPGVEGKILNTSPVLNHQRSANASAGNVFTLFPFLGQKLTILGTVMFRAWLSAESTSYGRLAFTIYEVYSNGEIFEAARIEGYVALTPKVDEYTFGVAGVNHTFTSGSTIQFRIDFVPSISSVAANLYWDGERTPTQLVLPCLDYLNAQITFSDGKDALENFFPLNDSQGNLTIGVTANFTDPFGTGNVKSSTLTLKNSTGHEIMKEAEMTLRKLGPALYTTIYDYNMTLAEGIFTVIFRVLDVSGNYHTFTSTIGAASYHRLFFKVSDGNGTPLSNITLTIVNPKLVYTSITNQSGIGEAVLPSSKVIGDYNITLNYKNLTFTFPLKVLKSTIEPIEFTIPLYTVKAKVEVYGLPLYGAVVSLIQNSKIISNMTIGSDGYVTFKEVPKGEYTFLVDFFIDSYSKKISVEGPHETIITVQTFYLNIISVLVIGALVSGFIGVIAKVIGRPKPQRFKFINKLIIDGLPLSATVMVSGPPASGKTVLLGNLLNESLKQKRKCVYVTNTDFPGHVRGHLKNLNIDLKKYDENILFIDCYSSIAGQDSKERYHINNPNDLTRLGMEISLAIEYLGSKTDVYFDSLSTIIPTLKPEQIVSFIHTTGAKIKGIEGRFCFTIGSEVDPGILMKVDEATDCVIQLDIQETDHQILRRLRIKKVRGKEHYSRWTSINIKPGEGIIFHAERKIFKRLYS